MQPLTLREAGLIESCCRQEKQTIARSSDSQVQVSCPRNPKLPFGPVVRGGTLGRQVSTKQTGGRLAKMPTGVREGPPHNCAPLTPRCHSLDLIISIFIPELCHSRDVSPTGQSAELGRVVNTCSCREESIPGFWNHKMLDSESIPGTQ